MNLSFDDLKNFLEEKTDLYNRQDFIKDDPIQIPHSFSLKQDIEISGLLAATLAWGKRIIIINSSRKLMQLMDNQPYDFVMNHSYNDLKVFKNFKHRTYNSNDVIFFIKGLKSIYHEYNSLENAFAGNEPYVGIINFRTKMMQTAHEYRSEKHISNPAKGSAAKRLNMFLRWMVRKDKSNVDFGIWNNYKPSQLYIPLDVHSGRVARELGLLKRKQNDKKAVEELTAKLRVFDSNDPVKYDYALFGLGVFENF
ncbi:MAG TPA: TIGR02757 family protein [Bacteroidales bacterium]|nr:TIGR02757 family protein [Bacteroidales bacterium]MDD4234982.1 TIGR02757 family protein [Bacteroidales bacterium]HXK82473.1 TIGR02757 family protein [Bacteroidales bacterium]